MSHELDDGEFWLPSEFLTDDDLFMDFQADHLKTTKSADDFSLGFGNSSGFNSDLSSPVESVMGSTENESDEDEFISGLTNKMSQATLQGTDASSGSNHTSKGLKLPGSPQSTLCGFKPGSNHSTPNSDSRVSSPPESKEAMSWNLLYAAAGEVARMRMTEETAPFHNTQRFPPPQKPSSPVQKPNPAPTYYPNHAAQASEAHLSYLQLQANHFQRMQHQQQMMKSGVWGQGKMEYHQFQNGKINGEIGKPQGGLSMANWPTLQQSQQQPHQQPPPQQQAGSGMRAVFLGETGAKKERVGTGVFLPRRFGAAPAENRKKPGCSVLLPDRVVHALNLNLNTVDSQSHLRGNRNFTPEYDARLPQRNNNTMFAHHQRRSQSQIPQAAMNQELRLPQEWTY